jgi:DNA-binding NarL/FixJ family response regulator
MTADQPGKKLRILVVADTCVSETGLTTIVARSQRYSVCASAHGFFDAEELVRRHQPDVLLIEPFLGDRDGILWIRELARQHPETRILIATRRCEQIYAERALQAGAAGYWMENGHCEELLRAIDTVADGDIYASPAITALAMQRFARRTNAPGGVSALSDRELAVFSLIAAGRRPGEIASELGISRKTIETHCEHIKQKLGYANAEELKAGARTLLGPPNVARAA